MSEKVIYPLKSPTMLVQQEQKVRCSSFPRIREFLVCPTIRSGRGGPLVCLQNILTFSLPHSNGGKKIQNPPTFERTLLSHIFPSSAQVDGLDVVVGGHTNTFLWTQGESPSKKDRLESPSGPYPTVVEQASGRRVLVVQTSGYGKYLGRLKVTFDERTGDVLDYSGNPVLLDASVEKDAGVEAQVRAYAEKVRGDEALSSVVYIMCINVTTVYYYLLLVYYLLCTRSLVVHF